MVFKPNSIYCGDCQKVLFNHFPEESIDLIYIDPPFFSNKNYEVIWGNGHELRAFEDRWKGGIENYISWMEPKMRECHRVLKRTGSIYLHCDWHANAHLRILMDGIFSENNFQNEIIWYYRGGGVSKKRFGRRHATLFFYTKGDDWTFNVDEVRTPYSEDVLKSKPSRYDKSYRKNKVYSGYRPNPKGKHPDDVWEIQPIMPSSKERLGYPTQKPESLLEQIIKVASNPTDIVLDPMCGCGTAIAVAYKLNRRYMGIDVSPTACELMLRRIHNIDPVNIPYNKSDILGLPRTIEEIREMQPFEFQNWVCEKLLARPSTKRSGDMGIDGWLIDGRPLQVKQSEGVGRNIVDNFETAIQRKSKTQGIIVAYSFSRGAYEEAARAKNKFNLDIELRTLEELLREE